MNIQRFNFAFHGQDFDWWDIDMDTGQVVDCGPSQAWFWADGKTFVNLDQPHGLGDRLCFTRDIDEAIATGKCGWLKYPITSVGHPADPVNLAGSGPVPIESRPSHATSTEH